MKIQVQFKDETKAVIVAAFGCSQDPEVFPNQGEVDNDDPRYLEFTGQSAEPRVPFSVTKRQGRLALLSAGKLDLVAEAIAALPSPQREAADIEWNDATNYERNSPFVVLLGEKIGLDSAELDALFIEAANL
jgi:hypothetical protein